MERKTSRRTEFEMSMYTKESLMREVVDNIAQRHPYELPKITVLEPVYTLPEYDEWVSMKLSNHFDEYSQEHYIYQD